jgi:OmcA/MtrC family decaheme c-type cytochrome
MRDISVCWSLAVLLAVGCAGSTGTHGAKGDPGLDGTPGQDGKQGPPGTPGVDGAPGPQGDAGTDGTDGTDGADGHASYVTGAGLRLALQGATIAGGHATVTFRITDDAGVPLDRTGHFTEGAVSLSWVIARLATDPSGAAGQYTSYLTRTQTDPTDPTKTAVQATSETAGAFVEVGADTGVYRYTFASPVVPPDLTQTHTIGVWATRTYRGARAVVNATLDLRPDALPVTLQRQEVSENSCNSCHATLAAHGGLRRETSLCILCHSPQTSDAETGNTVDFKVLIHKIHMGERLPSVVNGVAYRLVGYQGAVSDFSHVELPQDVGHCAMCHRTPAGPAGGSPTNAATPDAWKTKIGTTACFSCHDNLVATPRPGSATRLDISMTWPTDFGLPATGACTADADCRVGFQTLATCNHTNGHCQLVAHPTGNVGEADCVTCHAPDSAVAPVDRVHADLKYDASEDRPKVEILSVANTAPGQAAVMTFQVTDLKTGEPWDILAHPLARIAATVAGPTTDYATQLGARVQGSPTVGTLAADPSGTAGRFTYTFPATVAVPTAATGTFAFGLEGYAIASDRVTRLAFRNPVFYAAVTDPAPVPRKAVVDTGKCESCHQTIGSNHGFARNNVEYCVLCHNANLDDKDRLPMLQGASVTAQSVHFPELIHKIHRGQQLSQGYAVGGSKPTAANTAGAPDDFGGVVFPGVLSDCTTCHLEGTASVPLPPGRLPSLSERFTCNEPLGTPNTLCTTNAWTATATSTPPEAAACLACHDEPAAAIHASVMTSALGESCAVCHGPGSAFGVDVVHARTP